MSVVSLDAYRSRIRITKREWVEYRYTAHVEDALNIPYGLYELDPRGVVTSVSLGGRDKGREIVGRNFFTEVAPALRTYLPHYAEQFSGDAENCIESADRDIELVRVDDSVVAIVSLKGRK